MKFEEVADFVDGIPHMTRDEGRTIYEHVRASKPSRILEIGTANGVSASYMAAALQENGSGMVDTIDSVYGASQHTASDTIARAGLEDLVHLIRTPHSSYNWWLKNAIDKNSDYAKNCSPIYGFCYLDGSHNFTVDGLAFYLIERLLQPGAWLLFDDLDWSYANSNAGRETGAGELGLSDEEHAAYPMREVFDQLVMGHRSFSSFKVEDERWGWALKQDGYERSLSLTTSESLANKFLRRYRSFRR